MIGAGALALAMSASAHADLARCVDGSTAPRWRAHPDWSPNRAAPDPAVADRDGWIEFSIGRNAPEEKPGVMTWTFDPGPDAFLDEARYLVFRCRATGLASSGDYLFMAQDGSPDWRRYLNARMLRLDGSEQVFAIDLLDFLPPAGFTEFAVRIGPADAPRGKLQVKIESADKAPPGAVPVRQAHPAEDATVRIDAETLDWKAHPDWITNPAAQHRFEAGRGAVRFRAEGSGLAMRWTTRAPAGIDSGALPYLAVRYRARGGLASGGYTLHLAVYDGAGNRTSVAAMTPRHLDVDGAWHIFHTQVEPRGEVRTLAMGVDCAGPDAEVELDWIAFANAPVRVAAADLLPFDPDDSRRAPVGRGEFVPVSLPENARPDPLTLARLGIGDWFPNRAIAVAGIPFRTSPTAHAMPMTGFAREESVAVELPPGARPREILLLLAAAFPFDELFGSSARTRAPLLFLDEPERLTLELAYADGTVEELLPVDARKERHGVGHHLGLYAVRPIPGRDLRRIALRDRMRSGAFGIVGATLNNGEPRIPEPDLDRAWLPQEHKAAPADFRCRFDTAKGLAWARLESPMFGGAIAAAGEPVFTLRLGERDIPSTQWRVERAGQESDGGYRAEIAWAEAGASLRATFSARRVEARTTVLALELLNAGADPVAATLLFPQLNRVAIGAPAETWYLSGRIGGVIHRAPCALRDEIGEPHPLQLDGFFNPTLGAGLALMPRDLDGVFRWYNLGKDESGGRYSVEYLPQTVAPGSRWTSVEVALAAVPGGWREQLALYRAWTRTWYRPQTPRKPWFTRLTSIPTYCPSQPFNRPLDERLDLAGVARGTAETLGTGDYVHLYGWAISEEYGHWGEYNHFHQLGGRERFVQALRQCQGAGARVGLYLDGYLVSTRAQTPPPDTRARWAIRDGNGEPLYHKSYDAHSMCPYVDGWREHLADAYARVARELRPDGMYLDEFGRCMPSRICHATDHGHPAPAGMAPGEWILTRRIRSAVPPQIPLYCEFAPADVARQWLDGAFGHVALAGHKPPCNTLAPHHVDLARFAFPDFKIFELIYYVPLENGNWHLLKYPFFNGSGYYLTGPSYKDPAPAPRAFLRRALALLRRYADAFASSEVEPLVPTEWPGLYANRFETPTLTVWTVFNSNPRTARGRLLTVPHRDGARYIDAWNDRPLHPTLADGGALLEFEIGPRAVGCVARTTGAASKPGS